KITAEELDFDGLKAGGGDEMPAFANLRFEGITGDDTVSAMMGAYGVPRTPADVIVIYKTDPATKLFTLSKLELGLRGQSKLTLGLVIEEMNGKVSKAQESSQKVRLREATLVVEDFGLLALLLPTIAKQQGTTPEALVAMAIGPLGAFTAGQGPETVKAIDAVASFVGDWKKTHGPLKISLSPAKSASFADLGKLQQPNALVEVFGLKVDYAGARSGAAGGTGGAAPGGQSASAAPASPPASPPAASPDKPTTGGEAWLSIVGNTLTGRIDGEVIFEYYRKDGTLSLMEGDEITKGRWSLEGEKVCFKYPDEDKDCQTLSRAGDEVTFTRAGGKKGYRLKLLPGNPKNL
ncbi:MAG: hypothetical protein JOY81_04990, partial [Alphaproteobacteria bacterium]|nr:hypothetical protein [Alphaproteobacteria bacterium]